MKRGFTVSLIAFFIVLDAFPAYAWRMNDYSDDKCRKLSLAWR